MTRDEVRNDVQSAARAMVDNFRAEIAQSARDAGEVSTDILNDYPGGDSYHHENHMDIDWSLEEASVILAALADHKETDSGLWNRQEPEQAVCCQAAYTHGNAVSSAWGELIGELNSVLLTHKTDSEDSREGLAILWLAIVCDLEEASNDELTSLALACRAGWQRGKRTLDLGSCGVLADWLTDHEHAQADEFRKALLAATAGPEVAVEDD